MRPIYEDASFAPDLAACQPQMAASSSDRKQARTGGVSLARFWVLFGLACATCLAADRFGHAEAPPTRTHLDPSNRHQEEEHQSKGKSDHTGQLSFEWRSRPSNKCSKDCGAGRKLKRFACVDLKYELHVEDKHCLSVGLVKPEELSDEPCNEVECPAEWIEIEFQECRGIGTQKNELAGQVHSAGKCRPVRYKRLQCSMIDHRGQSVYLEDSQCAQTLVGTESKSIVSTPEPDEMVGLESLDQLETGEESMEIIQAFQDEPFYDAGPWSECKSESCSLAGFRTRKLICKVKLSPTAEVVDNTWTACEGLFKPHSEEACYPVCSSNVNKTQLEEELSHEVELNRFEWRRNGWTRCSAECSGGQRESLIECWDGHTDSPVAEFLCEPDMKPDSESETCNEFPCPTEWQVGSWSECSRTCGSSGTKTRSVECVQQVSSEQNSTSVNQVVVSSDLCSESKPELTEPCNRVDCPPEWSVGSWSECSRQCGVGVRNRTVLCVQEYANQIPEPVENHGFGSAVAHRRDWYQGKMTEVPLVMCYEHCKTMPITQETCANYCSEGVYIESDPLQHYQDISSRRTVHINLGGYAEIIRGKNLKIRCRVKKLHKAALEEVEWWKDGIKLFHTQSHEESNLILGPEDSLINTRSISSVDEASAKARRRYRGYYQDSADEAIPTSFDDSINIAHVTDERYSKLKSNTLRIRKLRPSDSGLFTCSYKSARDSVYISVK